MSKKHFVVKRGPQAEVAGVRKRVNTGEMLLFCTVAKGEKVNKIVGAARCFALVKRRGDALVRLADTGVKAFVSGGQNGIRFGNKYTRP